jgi:HEAT repeat protein
MDGERDRLFPALWRTICDQTSNRTLFILDGLDEVSGERNSSGTDLTEIFGDLLNRQNVIITSRPYAAHLPSLDPFDLELETIGFRSDQIQTYLAKVVNNKDKSERIWSFIQGHWPIQGLVQIPIQLDALCYSWDTQSGLSSGGAPETMTALYQAIEIKLWKKDMLRLGNSPPTETDLRHFTPSRITSTMKDLSIPLQYLAFTGMYNDIIEFDVWYRDKAYNPRERDPAFRPSDFVKLSFIRTSDSSYTSEDDNDGNFHFIHMSFQEYFAAKYFVECWINNQQVCIEPEPITPEKFLQQKKYNGRYDIFWRFVAGLLQHQDKGQLYRFFKMLNDEPRDLLGPVHQRLLMHCFSEVPSSDTKSKLEDLRTEMESKLKQLAFLEYKVRKEMKLCWEMEFPVHILLEEESTKKAILRALVHRPQLSSVLLNWVASNFLVPARSSPSSGLRYLAIAALGKQTTLPENLLEVVRFHALNDGHGIVRSSALNVLSRQSTLSESVQLEVMKEYLNKRWQMMHQLKQELHKRWQIKLPICIPENISDHQSVLEYIQHTDLNVRRLAVKALHPKLPWPKNILEAVISLLEDTDSVVRCSALNVLLTRSALPEEILKDAVLSQLEDTDPHVRQSVVRAFHDKPTLRSSFILQAVESRLQECTDPNVRRSIIAALGSQPTLQVTALRAIVSQLEDTYLDVRLSAVEAIRSQTTPLPADILQAVVSYMKDIDSNMRLSAVNALHSQSTLSEDILQAVVSQLEDTDLGVRKSALHTLGRQSTFSESIFQALMSRLEDPESDVSGSAFSALTEYSTRATFPARTLSHVLNVLGCTNLHRRRVLGTILAHQDISPKEIFKAVTRQLNDTDPDVRDSAAKALGRRTSTLPRDVLEAMESHLKSGGSNVKRFAFDVLYSQTALSENILEAVRSCLEDPDVDVRMCAIDALGRQRTALPDNVLQDIVSLLGLKGKEYCSRMRYGAINILRNQAPLSDDILRALAKVLSNNTDIDIRPLAENVLLKRDRLYDIFPYFNEETMFSMYTIFLQHSFDNQLSCCYTQDGNFCINMPDRRREIYFLEGQW